MFFAPLLRGRGFKLSLCRFLLAEVKATPKLRRPGPQRVALRLISPRATRLVFRHEDEATYSLKDPKEFAKFLEEANVRLVRAKCTSQLSM